MIGNTLLLKQVQRPRLLNKKFATAIPPLDPIEDHWSDRASRPHVTIKKAKGRQSYALTIRNRPSMPWAQ